MHQSIDHEIIKPLAHIKLAHELWLKINITWTIELFESLFTCKQGNPSLQNYFNKLRAIFQELFFYQPPTMDLHTLERYCEKLYDVAYLSFIIHPTITYQIKGQILLRDNVLSISFIFSITLCQHMNPTKCFDVLWSINTTQPSCLDSF